MRFTFSLSWKASAKKANIRERHWNMRQYRFVAHSFFLHTNTLIKKSLFEFDGFDTSFFYVRDYVLQLVSPHTLSLSVVRITALSSSAVLKSIFNSVLTRVPFVLYLMCTSNILRLKKGSLYIDTFFINPSSFNSFTAEYVAWAAHTQKYTF